MAKRNTTSSATHDLASVGTKIDEIPVELGFRIIDLFSGQLYSNPAKALEELIINSFDAFAERCDVILPENLDDPRAKVLVWDNGDSMNLAGLKELWLIAESAKRQPAREQASAKRGRLPIGKFGIGKLASYTIGRRISHICMHNGQVLAVTMDYHDIVPDGETSTANPKMKATRLNVRRLTDQEARRVLDFTQTGELPGGVVLPLFGKESPSSWTLVVVDHLKPPVREIHRGRLKWIVSTALPLVPDFAVALNGDVIRSHKLSKKVLKRWQIGAADKVALKLGFKTGKTKGKEKPFDKWVEIPGVGKIHGELILFEQTLTGGKAEDYGRSHGFFVKVRHRLVNYEDEVFGSHALAHQTLNRLNATIFANGLDPMLVASREEVATTPKELVMNYAKRKFYEIRDWYEAHLEHQAKEETIADRVQSIPRTLISFPLRHAVETASQPGAPTLHSIVRPPTDGKVEMQIRGFDSDALDPLDPIAIFDTTTGMVTLNEAHPFVANYRDSIDLHVVATAEIMLEAYMLEAGFPGPGISEVMQRRDELLRELVRETPEGVDMIAMRIRDAVSDEHELESACHAAMRALGFEVTPLGGSGKPDGLASAELGMKVHAKTNEDQSRAYMIAYDAKSTGAGKVKSAHLDLAGIKRHREKFNAKYSLVIAPAFEGEEQAESKANVEAGQQQVTLVRAADMARLIESSGRLPLSLDGFRELLNTCRTPPESQAWIDKFCSGKSDAGVDKELLDAIWAKQGTDPRDPPHVSAVRETSSVLKKYSTTELVEKLKSLARLVPDLIHVRNDIVYLDQKPDKVVHHIRQRLRHMEAKPDAKTPKRPAHS